MEVNKNIEILKSKILQRQFMYNQQGYTLIKYMVFKYVLTEVGVSFPSVKEFDCKIEKHFETIKPLIYENLEKISYMFGDNVKDLVLNCIVSFSSYNVSDSGFEQALLIIEEMSQEDIINFILNDSDNLGGKEICSTPETLSNLVSLILSNTHSQKSWLDLGCGDGNFLVNVAKKFPHDVFFGVEVNYNSYLLTCLKLAFMKVHNRIFNSNIFDYSGEVSVDYVFAHIPFGVKVGSFPSQFNNKFVGPLKQSQTVEWAFIDLALQCMNSLGRGCVVIPDGLLTNIMDVEQRARLVKSGLIECIIKLPTNFFSYTSISTSLIVFDKNKKVDYIKFIDASELCIQGRRFSELDVEAILDEYKNGGRNSLIVKHTSIEESNYNLSLKKYKDVHDIKLQNPRNLGELVIDIFRGVQLQARVLDKYTTLNKKEDVYRFVNSGDINDGSFIIEELNMIDSEKNLDRYILQDGDVLITSKSTKVKTAITEIRHNEKIIPSGSIVVIRCRKDLINPVYLKAFFDSNNGRKLLESIQTGTTIISINPSALQDMVVECLPFEKQEQIATKFLQTMDMLRYEKQKVAKLENELNTVFDSLLED